MIEVAIPGFKDFEVDHLVVDYNGTLARDGTILPGVASVLLQLAKAVTLHVVTADTHGRAQRELAKARLPAPFILDRADRTPEDVQKAAYVRALGSDRTVCVGNGRNDRLMLKEAVLGIAVVADEGAAVDALRAADVVFTDPVAALSSLLKRDRLRATLRAATLEAAPGGPHPVPRRRGIRRISVAVRLTETRKKNGARTELRWAVTEESYTDHSTAGSYRCRMLRHPGIVVIVPVTPDDKIVLLRQHRFSVGHDKLWELPAGTLEGELRDGLAVAVETPLACAVRELEEEAQLVAADVEEVMSFYSMPGTTDQRVTVCLATGVRTRRSGERRTPDSDELIREVREFPRAVLRRMLAAHKIRDAKTIVALLYALRLASPTRPRGARSNPRG